MKNKTRAYIGIKINSPQSLSGGNGSVSLESNPVAFQGSPVDNPERQEETISGKDSLNETSILFQGKELKEKARDGAIIRNLAPDLTYNNNDYARIKTAINEAIDQTWKQALTSVIEMIDECKDWNTWKGSPNKLISIEELKSKLKGALE